jgi:hypothetical protein
LPFFGTVEDSLLAAISGKTVDGAGAGSDAMGFASIGNETSGGGVAGVGTVGDRSSVDSVVCSDDD